MSSFHVSHPGAHRSATAAPHVSRSPPPLTHRSLAASLTEAHGQQAFPSFARNSVTFFSLIYFPGISPSSSPFLSHLKSFLKNTVAFSAKTLQGQLCPHCLLLSKAGGERGARALLQVLGLGGSHCATSSPSVQEGGAGLSVEPATTIQSARGERQGFLCCWFHV